MNRQKQIQSHKQFAQLVIETKGARIFTARAVTDRSASKAKSAPQVLQEMIFQGRVGQDYERTVNARLVAEGKAPSFKAKPLPWGKHVLDSKGNKTGLIEHKGAFYMQSEVFRALGTKRFYLDGKLVSEEIAAPFMKAKSAPSARQAEAGLSQEREYKPRSFKFDSIKEISFAGKRIELATV